MHVPASWTLGRAAALRGEVEQALMSEVAGPARVDPAAAVERRGALQRCPGIAVIALVQRVAEARVAIGGRVVGAIGRGAAAVRVRRARRHRGDRRPPGRQGARAAHLRRRRRQDEPDVAAVGGGLLIVSQFTLAADTSRGNRPSFTGAARAELGRRLYERVLATARRLHARRRQRRVRRRHAGQPRQRRAGDDPDHAARLSAPAPPLSRRTGRPP